MTIAQQLRRLRVLIAALIFASLALGSCAGIAAYSFVRCQ